MHLFPFESSTILTYFSSPYTHYMPCTISVSLCDHPNSMWQSPSWGKVSLSASKATIVPCGIREFIIVFARVWVRWFHSAVSHPVSLKFTLILTSRVRLGFTKYYIPLSCCNEISIFPICTTIHAYIILIDLVTLVTFGEEIKLWRSSLWYFMRTPHGLPVLALTYGLPTLCILHCHV
jgi:hypothetical protein